MANGLSIEFGTYKHSTSVFTVNSGAHWFADDYWKGTGTSVAIRVTNTSSSPVRFSQFKFSLINGISDGRAFLDNSGNLISTTASTASIYAVLEGVNSNTVTVGRDGQSFEYSPTEGQSYWKYRPSNSSGTTLFPDDADHDKVEYYTFKFNSSRIIQPGGSAIITFRASWNTDGTHVIQIYPVNGIVIPITHTVTWKTNGGIWTDGSSADIVDDVADGGSTEPPTNPTRDSYQFTGWDPADTAYTNVTSDLVYTAQWQLATTTCTFWRNHDSNDTTVLKSGSVQINSTIASAKTTLGVSDPDWEGYTFLGWSTSRAGSVVGNNTHVTAQVHDFYAKWQVQSGPVTFYRNYDADDDTILATRDDIEYINQTLNDVKPEKPVRTGYKFLGWALSRTGYLLPGGLSLWDKSSHSPHNIFYARWEKVYTIWVRENGVWVKKLNVRKYNASDGTWSEQPPRQMADNGWVDKS